MKETKDPIIIELFIFIKTINYKNIQNQQRLQKFEPLLNMKNIIIQNNQKQPYEYFRKNETKLTNQEFEIYENLIKKQNSINQNQFWYQFFDLSQIVKQNNNQYDILFLQAFIRYFTQDDINIHEVASSENQNFIIMIYNVFIYCSNYLNFYTSTSNIYQDYQAFQSIRQFIQIIEFCIEFLYIKHPWQKLQNNYLINALFRVGVILYEISDIGVRKGTINETKDDRSLFIKQVKAATDKLEFISYKYIDVQSLFLGFSRIFFEGCNLNYLLEFLCKIYSQADFGDYRPLTDFFMINNIKKTSLLNLMYEDDLINFFAKFNSQKNNFIMFIIQMIWSFSLKEFEINKHLIYRFLDQILSHKIQKLYKVMSNFFSYCLKRSIDKINKKQQQKETNDKEDNNQNTEEQIKKINFRNLKQMNFTLCLLMKCLCNPVFKSYFVNQKKTEILIDLFHFLFIDENYQKQKLQFESLCDMINNNLLQCLQICVNHRFGIRTLIKVSEDENLEKIQMVEDMPIEKHIQKLFEIFVKIDYKNIKNENIIQQLLQLYILLTDNYNGKNILMALRQKKQQQEFLQLICDKIQKPNVWLIFLKFILNFMEKPKKIINLQLMTFLLNISKSDKNEIHVNRLIEFFEQLKTKNSSIKKNNKQKFLQIRIDYAFDIINKAIKKITSKKEKFLKYFKKKVKTNYIDLLPEDMEKRLEKLEKELGLQNNNNKEIDEIIKLKKFDQLSNKTIQLFKQQNLYELTEYFYNIQSLNQQQQILQDQYQFQIKLNQFPKIEKYWKFQYKPIQGFGQQIVIQQNSKLDTKEVKIIQPIQKINEQQNEQQKQKNDNQQDQKQQNDRKNKNHKKQNKNQKADNIQYQTTSPELYQNYTSDQIAFQQYHNQEPILNFQNATQQGQPLIQQDYNYQQLDYNNFVPLTNPYQDNQNYIQPQSQVPQDQINVHAQPQIDQQNQQYQQYQNQMYSNIPINPHVQPVNGQIIPQYYDQNNYQFQDPQGANLAYIDPAIQQAQYVFDPVTQQYYYYAQPTTEYTINSNAQQNFINPQFQEQVYNPNIDNYYVNEDEKLKDVEFSDDDDQNKNSNSKKKIGFFDKFNAKK